MREEWPELRKKQHHPGQRKYFQIVDFVFSFLAIRKKE